MPRKWIVVKTTMRLSAAFHEEARLYRVYDYPVGQMRHDLCWVDDGVNQVGVGFATRGQEYVVRIEQRKHILIIPGVYWIALDLPEEEVRQEHKINIPELFSCHDPELMVVK